MSWRLVAILAGLLAVVFAVRSLAGVAVILLVLGAGAARLPPALLARVTLDRSGPARLFHGESGQVQLTVTNRGRGPIFWLAITELIPFDLAIHPLRWITTLRAGESRAISYSITGRRRGVFRLGPATLVSSDPLGLRPAQRPLADGPTVIVYPRIVPIERLGLPATAPFPDLRAHLPLYEDPNRIIGVRPYATTDSGRRIHWTASAHHGSLLVTRLQPGIGRETVVLLDLSREGMGTRARHVETAVTVAASVLFHVVTRERLAAGLRYRDISLAPSSEHAHLMAMLEILAIASVHELSTEELIEPVGLSFGASVVLVTRRFGADVQFRLYSLLRRGWRPCVIQVGDDPVPEIPGIPVWPVVSDRELAEALGGG
ncbi:MAG TPA: DUF58 domain-containing protein [Acidimicrobiia bacterium]|nr:DUF58 domain-containing protein [Acidimicrobiia bacterium]